MNFILAENRAKRMHKEFPRVIASRRRALARVRDIKTGNALNEIDLRLKKWVAKYRKEGVSLSGEMRKRLAEDYSKLAAQRPDRRKF